MLNFEKEVVNRRELSDQQRVDNTYRRQRFLGEPRAYDQILHWVNGLDGYPVGAPEREKVLEELCIFASFSDSNRLKLVALNAMRHACKSFAATSSPATVTKALTLCGYLLSKDGSGQASKQLATAKGITEIISFLDSPDKHMRVESLFILEKLSEHMEPYAFRELSSKFQSLSKVNRLLSEGVEEITAKETVFRAAGRRKGRDPTAVIPPDQLDNLKIPLQFGIETTVSCLNLYRNYLKRNQRASQKVRQDITSHIANVRGVEMVAKAYGTRHQDFRTDRRLHRQILEIRCAALEIMSLLEFTPSILGEIAYQGALDKIIYTYMNRFLSKDGRGADDNEEDGQDDDKKYIKGSVAYKTREVHLYENDDFLLEMHTSAVAFVRKLTSCEHISLLSVFKEDDIEALVRVTAPISASHDLLKLGMHLETLKAMVESGEKLALLMCQKGLCLFLNEALYLLTETTASKLLLPSQGGAGLAPKYQVQTALRLVDLVDRDGARYSTYGLQLGMKKTIVQTYILLL